MKIRTVLAGIFAGLTITAACACSTAHADFPTVPEGYYPATFVVTEVEWDAQGKLQILTGKDAVGHLWQWYSDAGDWVAGDMVSAIMYDMGTPDDIYDDIMLSERYVGIPDWYLN